MKLELGPQDEELTPAELIELLCFEVSIFRTIRDRRDGWYKGDNQLAKESVEEGQKYRKQKELEKNKKAIL